MFLYGGCEMGATVRAWIELRKRAQEAERCTLVGIRRSIGIVRRKRMKLRYSAKVNEYLHIVALGNSDDGRES